MKYIRDAILITLIVWAAPVEVFGQTQQAQDDYMRYVYEGTIMAIDVDGVDPALLFRDMEWALLRADFTRKIPVDHFVDVAGEVFDFESLPPFGDEADRIYQVLINIEWLFKQNDFKDRFIIWRADDVFNRIRYAAATRIEP